MAKETDAERDARVKAEREAAIERSKESTRLRRQAAADAEEKRLQDEWIEKNR